MKQFIFKEIALIGLLLAFFLRPAVASSLDEEALLLSYGDEDFVSIATGRKQLISRAPAIASVITSDEIQRMGAKDLDEVLDSLPGVHVSRRAAGYNPNYIIRGIHADFNPQVLVLVNGIPITTVYTGDRGTVWGGMPVENVSRVEVIRGPGSAIYGADAYAGTINIITKEASEIDGFQVGVSVGSFSTHHAWVQYGGNIKDWDAAVSLELFDTDGHDERVMSDAQQMFDFLFATMASFAPGPVNTERKGFDLRADISKELFRFRLGYQKRDNVGAGAGVFGALDPLGEGGSDRFNFDATYHNPELTEFWDVKLQFSYYDAETRTDLFLLPPGTRTLPFGPDFPEGVVGRPDVYERHYRFDASAFYTGIEDHDIRIGAGYYYQDLYRVEEKKNFRIDLDLSISPPRPLIIPLGGLVDVSDSAPFVTEEVREVYYAFIQDEWKFARDWSLTAGLRFDDYSDFGNTVNPRLALVWQTSLNLTTKLLYGRAFRAPSFAEQFNINNPVAVGNEDLDPEIINTYEIAFDYSPTADFRTGLNIFYYKMEDIIRFNPTVADNTGDQTGQGLEWEFEWDITNDLKLVGNYAYQDSEDEDTDSDAPNAPRQQIYLRANYRFTPVWSLNAQANHVMDRKRAAGDLRPEVDDYTTLDLVLRGRDVIPGWEVAVSVRNLADEDVYEPSLAPGFIPDDLPQAGRSVFAEIRKRW